MDLPDIPYPVTTVSFAKKVLEFSNSVGDMWPCFRMRVFGAKSDTGKWELLLLSIKGELLSEPSRFEEYGHMIAIIDTISFEEVRRLVKTLGQTGSVTWRGYTLDTDPDRPGNRSYPDASRPYGHPTPLVPGDEDNDWWQAWFDFSCRYQGPQRFVRAEAEATSLGYLGISYAARAWLDSDAEVTECKIQFRFPLPLAVSQGADSHLQILCYKFLDLSNAKVSWSADGQFSSRNQSAELESVVLDQENLWHGSLPIPKAYKTVFLEFPGLLRKCPYMIREVQDRYSNKEVVLSRVLLGGRKRGRRMLMPVPEHVRRFRKDHKDQKSALIIMRFGTTRVHRKIAKAVRDTLKDFGIDGVRADDKEYADDLYTNVKTYMDECLFGVSIFERLEGQEINANVAFEVGYLLGKGKKVCLLKDMTLERLQSDIVGKLYKDFDPQEVPRTIRTALSKWLEDQGYSRIM